jgi:2-keto-3-deoxy-L-rhamnonate aldolase RhmA
MHPTQSVGRKLKDKLRSGETTFGLWVTLESPTVSEIAARVGLDWICVDLEHGELDLQEVTNHLRAIRNTGTACLVRISMGRSSGCSDLGRMGSWYHAFVPQRRWS